MTDPASEPPSPEKQRVQVHYVKSNNFRVIACEGAIGSVSPHGKIFFTLYNERAAIPRSMTHTLDQQGALGPMESTETRGGIVREMEVGIIVDRDDAARLRDWLSAKIDQLDE